jgi:hypothetical protein
MSDPSVVTGSRNQLGLLMKYFVLNPHKDDPYGVASRAAILTYADCICDANPTLAKHLNDWMNHIEEHLEVK